jgi:hypothetical protein
MILLWGGAFPAFLKVRVTWQPAEFARYGITYGLLALARAHLVTAE